MQNAPRRAQQVELLFNRQIVSSVALLKLYYRPIIIYFYIKLFLREKTI